MERAKAEVEKKVSKLIKFIQNKNKIPKDSKRELLGIINDLQEQYESLYSVIQDFQEGSSDPKTGKRKVKSSSSASSSELEYYTSDEIVEISESNVLKEETEQKLEALNTEYTTLLRKLEEEELKNKNLRIEFDAKELELTARVKELEREVIDTKSELKLQSELEEEIVMKANESKMLGEKNKGLKCRISGLESVLKEKGDEISTLVNKVGNSEVGLTSRIEDLKNQLRNLEQETDFLRARNAELTASVQGLMDQVNAGKHEIESLGNQKNELESNLEKKTDEVIEMEMQLKKFREETEEQINELKEEMKSKIIEIENLIEENQKLNSRILELENIDETEDSSKKDENQGSDQEKLVKEQDEIINRLSTKIEDQKRVLNEQKETIEKFSEDNKTMKRSSIGSNRDPKLNPNVLERKMEELAEAFRMKMEDHIRLLYRRIHVAEQIHLESKNEYVKTREENRVNRENTEIQFKKVKDIMESAGTKMALKKLKEAEEHMNRVSRLAKEIDLVKIWVSEKNNEVETLEAKLECREAQECLLKEKLLKLEKKLAEEGTEKLSLAKVLSRSETRIKELEIDVKGREVQVLSLGEEKREAIRQLCVLVDYQRHRYDDLKKSVFGIKT